MQLSLAKAKRCSSPSLKPVSAAMGGVCAAQITHARTVEQPQRDLRGGFVVAECAEQTDLYFHAPLPIEGHCR